MAAPAARFDPGKSRRDLLRRIAHLAPNLLELPMRLAQRGLGLRRMAWLFLAPNLLIFGLFTFLPIILNFFYATTGGANILLQDRPQVGAENFRTLLSCANNLEPSTCQKDLFWRRSSTPARSSRCRSAAWSSSRSQPRWS
jgi:ABC-type sugar transport system permease subunit